MGVVSNYQKLMLVGDDFKEKRLQVYHMENQAAIYNYFINLALERCW